MPLKILQPAQPRQWVRANRVVGGVADLSCCTVHIGGGRGGGGGGGGVGGGKLNEQRENDRRVGGEEGAARGRVCHTAGLG